MPRRPCGFVFNYKATSTYGLNVILGALETVTPEVTVRLVKSREHLATAIEETLRDVDRVVVAWSFYSAEAADMFHAIRRIRPEGHDPRVIHIVGGVHATAQPDDVLQNGFSYAALGDGEKTIVEFAMRLLDGRDLKQIRGLSYGNDDGFVSNGRPDPVDLNTFPPFALKHLKFNPIEITRGCIYACRFCQTPFMFKAAFRHRSVTEVCRYVTVLREHALLRVPFHTDQTTPK